MMRIVCGEAHFHTSKERNMRPSIRLGIGTLLAITVPFSVAAPSNATSAEPSPARTTTVTTTSQVADQILNRIISVLDSLPEDIKNGNPSNPKVAAAVRNALKGVNT